MNYITVCVDKVTQYEICGSHRTSNGWIYRVSETISPKVWFSEPIDIEDPIAEKLCVFLQKYTSYHVDEDSGWDIQTTQKFEPNWTLEVVAILNFAISTEDVVFKAYDGSLSFTRAFYLVRENYRGIVGFRGYSSPRDRFEMLASPESPFNDINELKEGIIKLVETGNDIPDRWLAFLFVDTEEDIAPYLEKYSISLVNRKIGICQRNGELLPSLVNVNEGIVEEYKKGKPLISYEQACIGHKKNEIQWYQRYGADWVLEEIFMHYNSSENNEPDDYSYGDDEVDSWEEGWEWNID